MQIESIRHKALRRFAETGSAKGLPAGVVDRLRRMLAYMDAIEAAEELRVPPELRRASADRRAQGPMGADDDEELANDVSSE